MANFALTHAKHLINKGDIDFDVDDIRVMLVDSTTTADTEEDVTTISGITTLGELSGTGYVRKALANEIVNKDDANNRSEFDADDTVWTGINAGTAQAAIIYKHVTDDSDSIPLFYIDSDFPFVTNGGDMTIQWNAEGISQIA